MRTYLINLDRSTERLSIVTDRLAALGLTWERIPAVDGKTLTAEHKTAVVSPNWKFPTTLTSGEIGCMLSHRYCWEQFLATGDEWLLVLEDDCVFSPKAYQYLSSPDWIPEGVDLIQLSTVDEPAYCDHEISLPTLNNSLYRIKYSSPKGAYGYLISKRAAQLAVDMSRIIEEPADNFLFGHYSSFVKKISFFRLAKGIVKVVDDVPTTLPEKGKHKEWNLHRLSWKRFSTKLKMNLARKHCQLVQQQWLD